MACSPVESLLQLLQVLVCHFGRLIDDAISLGTPRMCSEGRRTLRVINSRRYFSSMSLYSVASSSRFSFSSASSVWTSPPRRACCES